MTFSNVTAKLRHDLHVCILMRMGRANWQSDYKPAVEYCKRGYLHSYFGVTTSKELGDEELGMACTQLRSAGFAFFTPPDRVFAKPTEAMVRKVLAIGYSIEKFAGKGFLRNWLPRLTERYWKNRLDATVEYYEFIRLDPHTTCNVYHLTHDEAVYCIKRLEKIELQLHRGNYERGSLLPEREIERIMRLVEQMTKV